MGVQEDSRPSGALGGLYRVQFVGRSIYSDDEAVKTSIMDSSTCEPQEDNGSGRRLLIWYVCCTYTKKTVQNLVKWCFVNDLFCIFRRLWQQRPPCLKPIHCSLSCMCNLSEIHNGRIQIFWHLHLLAPLCKSYLESGDKHVGETIANVVTSLPFIVLGLQTPRQAHI